MLKRIQQLIAPGAPMANGIGSRAGAEPLDGVVYAVAVRGLVNICMSVRENELRAIASSPELPITIHSAWMRKC